MGQIGYFATYGLYRTGVGLISLLPIEFVFLVGRLLGLASYLILWRPRRTALQNLAAAFPAESKASIREMAREHFQKLGANLLSSIKLAEMTPERASERVTVVVPSELEQRRRAGNARGWIAMISHLGNWEALAQLSHQMPEFRVAATYKKLRNPFIDTHIRKTRARAGITLFDRKTELLTATRFLGDHGALGVLVDQHAGDVGLWTPLFGRLASTSPLAANLALRANVPIVPLAVYTRGRARWEIRFSPLLEPTGDFQSITAEINQTLEAQVLISPTDWLWSHARWKIPQYQFLLDHAPLGTHVPAGTQLKPFRILIVAPSTQACRPAIESIEAGRPDAKVTVRSAPPGESLRSFVNSLRGNYEAAFLFDPSLRAALAVYLARIPKRLGYGIGLARWLQNQSVTPGTASIESTDYYLRLAQAAGANLRRHEAAPNAT